MGLKLQFQTKPNPINIQHMKAFLILILSFSFTLATFGQDYSDKDGLKTISREYYKDGKLKKEADTVRNKDGLKTTIMEYYEDGKLETMSTRSNNVKSAIKREYYETGKLKIEIDSTYNKDGLKTSNIEYYENGKLESLSTNANNVQSEVKKAYYENGKLKSETIWNNNASETKNYDSTGNEIK